MITRIVKLTIDPNKTEAFKSAFVDNKEHIGDFPGCTHLEILRDAKYSNIFFTYSKWETEDAIENYRKSDLFKGIWKNVKPMFCAKPEAWSLLS